MVIVLSSGTILSSLTEAKDKMLSPCYQQMAFYFAFKGHSNCVKFTGLSTRQITKVNIDSHEQPV